jgi:hypothetical protein
MHVQRAEPSGDKHRAPARSKAKPPEGKDKRNERQSHTRSTNTRATRGSFRENRKTHNRATKNIKEKTEGYLSLQALERTSLINIPSGNNQLLWTTGNRFIIVMFKRPIIIWDCVITVRI